MSEYYKEGEFPGELGDTSDDPELKSDKALYTYDAISSLTIDYINKETLAKKDEFVASLRVTLSIPEVSEESKTNIRIFLEKLEKGIIDN
jgi:hypothetical protein